MSDFSRTKWSIRMIWKTAKELSKDLSDYYFSSYPILLFIGAFRRLRRRLKTVWVPKGRGRPPVSEEIVNLILDMKRANRGWGALRISQELSQLGTKVSKTSVAGGLITEFSIAG